MAERRMFSKSIIDSDAFLSMPMSSQALYFHLSMRADDDGFVDGPRKIMRIVGAAEDDLRILITKRFILAFQSGVIVIKHWRLHNYIRKDRYKETLYLNEKSQLFVKENGSYTDHSGGGIYKSISDGLPIPEEVPDDEKIVRLPDGQPNDNQRLTQVRLGKDRLELDKDRQVKVSNKELAQSDDSIASVPAVKPIFSLPLNDNSLHPILQEEYDTYVQLYPNVDVLQELRKMYGWLDSNPTRRKTKKGVKRFINSWLAREQDRGRYAPPPAGGKDKFDTLGALNDMLGGDK